MGLLGWGMQGAPSTRGTLASDGQAEEHETEGAAGEVGREPGRAAESGSQRQFLNKMRSVHPMSREQMLENVLGFDSSEVTGRAMCVEHLLERPVLWPSG